MLKQLERVEEGIMGQDLVIKQLQLEKQTNEHALKVQIDTLQKNNEDLNKLASAAGDLERELASMKEEARTNKATLVKLKQEKKDAEVQLRMAVSSAEELRRKVEELEEAGQRAESKLKEEKARDEARIARIKSLKSQLRPPTLCLVYLMLLPKVLMTSACADCSLR